MSAAEYPTGTFNYREVTPSDQLWDEWLALFANRDEIAKQYAMLMQTYGGEWSGCRFLNAAILRRWSPAGLRYIKEKAWGIEKAGSDTP